MSSEYKYESTLLLDDSDLDNFINEKMLEANRFSKKIHVSTDGESALELIQQLIDDPTAEGSEFPEVLFVDLNMPVMSGFEFIENFKKIDKGAVAECKIIVLTSSIHNDDRLEAERIDRNIVFLNKPLTNELLRSL
jgi:CheY-like chemotaxis protein